MANTEILSPEAVAMFNAMAEAAKGKKKEKKAAKAKFIMVVDGKVLTELIPSKKDAKAAARAIVLKALANGRKEPVVAIAEINSLVTIDVPVASTEVDGIEK